MRDALLAPLVSLSLFILGSSYFNVIISAYLKLWQQTESMIGLLQGIYYGGLLLGAIGATSLIHRLGYRKSFALFTSMVWMSMLIMSLWQQLPVWGACRFVGGYATAGVYVLIESWLIAPTHESNRARRLSIYMMVFYASQAFSYVVLHATGTYASRSFLVGACLVALSFFPLRQAKPAVSSHAVSEPLPLKRLLRVSSLGVAACLLAGIIQGGLYAFIPSYALAKGFAPTWLMAITIVGGGLLQWPIGQLADRLNHLWALIGLSLILCIPCSVMFYIGESELAARAICFWIGGFSFAIYSLGLAISCDSVKREEITAAVAWMGAIYGVGSFVGPFIAPFFLQYGPAMIFAFYGLSSFLLALSCLFLGRYRSCKHPGSHVIR